IPIIIHNVCLALQLHTIALSVKIKEFAQNALMVNIQLIKISVLTVYLIVKYAAKKIHVINVNKLLD
ncbi:MAG: hypothetical protein ACKO96_24525, partial [Flammeovirgaceae bacterium]